MRIVVLNASSKKKGGASRCFSRILKLMLAGCQVTTVQVQTCRSNLGRRSWNRWWNHTACLLYPVADSVCLAVDTGGRHSLDKRRHQRRRDMELHAGIMYLCILSAWSSAS